MWISVAVAVDAVHADALSDALLGEGALSVSVEDALAGTERETPQFGEPDRQGGVPLPLWEESRVVALFEPAADLAERVARAARMVGLPASPPVAFHDVEEQDWVRLTQDQFAPIQIAERLWIVPSWHAAPDSAAVNLVLDPGLAFGTGAHPTTFLCLQWLAAELRGGETLLDYGCGSGILAIAAAKLGAARVLGVDIDDNALQATRDNAAANAVTLDVRHSAQAIAERFNVVIANILTNPLCVLAPLLAQRLAPGGRLVLSGVLATQAQQVIDAYAPYLALRIGATREGWVRLEGAAC